MYILEEIREQVFTVVMIKLSWPCCLPTTSCCSEVIWIIWWENISVQVDVRNWRASSENDWFITWIIKKKKKKLRKINLLSVISCLFDWRRRQRTEIANCQRQRRWFIDPNIEYGIPHGMNNSTQEDVAESIHSRDCQFSDITSIVPYVRVRVYA